MKKLTVLSILALSLILSGAATARVTQMRLPATVILRDNYQAFTAPKLLSRHGAFEVCLGECHEGDPGYGQPMDRGATFQLSLNIFQDLPRHQPLPYVTTTVVLANGREGMSVRPRGPMHRVIRFNGVTFDVTIMDLSKHYGRGESRVSVTVRD